MAALTDSSPELAYLGEVISELQLAGEVPPPEDQPYRAALVALSSIGKILEQATTDVSDTERAFATRDAAVRAGAELVMAITRDPVEIRLIREDLMRDMNRLCAKSEDALGELDPSYEGSGTALWALPHLASISDTLLADPDLSGELSRAHLLEDACNLLTVLMGLAWRLRAWATLEQV